MQTQSEFNRLPKHKRTILSLKIDGFVEAAILHARAYGIGATEGIELVISALLREANALDVDRNRMREVYFRALQKTMPLGSANSSRNDGGRIQ